MDYKNMEFEFYLYDEDLQEGSYCKVTVEEYEPPEIGDRFSPDIPEDFIFRVEDSGGERIVTFHSDEYQEYSDIVQECKRLGAHYYDYTPEI